MTYRVVFMEDSVNDDHQSYLVPFHKLLFHFLLWWWNKPHLFTVSCSSNILYTGFICVALTLKSHLQVMTNSFHSLCTSPNHNQKTTDLLSNHWRCCSCSKPLHTQKVCIHTWSESVCEHNLNLKQCCDCTFGRQFYPKQFTRYKAKEGKV